MIASHSAGPGVLDLEKAEIRDEDPCPVPVLISKDAEGEIRIWPDRRHECPCKCERVVDGKVTVSYALRYEGFWKLDSNEPCDEVRRALQLDGCYIRMRGALTLRDWECPRERHRIHAGCQHGRFVMYRPLVPGDPSSGFVPVFSGRMAGVVGVDPSPRSGESPDRCCQPDTFQGMLTGQGIGRDEDCRICVAYHGQFHELIGKELCERISIKWKANLDGTVICGCK